MALQKIFLRAESKFEACADTHLLPYNRPLRPACGQQESQPLYKSPESYRKTNVPFLHASNAVNQAQNCLGVIQSLKKQRRWSRQQRATQYRSSRHLCSVPILQARLAVKGFRWCRWDCSGPSTMILISEAFWKGFWRRFHPPPSICSRHSAGGL